MVAEGRLVDCSEAQLPLQLRGFGLFAPGCSTLHTARLGSRQTWVSILTELVFPVSLVSLGSWRLSLAGLRATASMLSDQQAEAGHSCPGLAPPGVGGSGQPLIFH